MILPLRGADPSLARCLTGLLRQDYPSYRLHIVIDGADDPAWAVVRDVLAREPGGAEVSVETLIMIGERCGLKVSAQRQAIEALGDDVEAVVFADADADPAADWLRRLTAPLADRAVGAACGIRWFDPPDGAWGSLVRYLNNAACFSNMFVFHIPWGGSLAMRRETIRAANLIEHWSRCLCEDTSAYEPLRRAGLRVAFVPQATQFNREINRCRRRLSLHPAAVHMRSPAPSELAAHPDAASARLCGADRLHVSHSRCGLRPATGTALPPRLPCSASTAWRRCWRCGSPRHFCAA